MAREARFTDVVDPTALLDTFRNIPMGLMVWQLVDAGDVGSLRLVDANGAAERELGTPLRDAIGKGMAEMLPSLLKTGLPNCCRRVVLSRKAETAGEVRYAGDFVQDRIFWFECFPLPGNCVGTAFENITDRKRSEQTKSGALQLLHRITVAINDSTSVAGAAEVLPHRGL
jgi:PAS domain-containing protein